MNAVIVSPHLDDAVLSCGQLMAGWPGIRVLTVCAGVPEDGFVSRYDADSGFATSREAMLERRREDQAALDLLGASIAWMGFMDGAYPDPPTQAAIAAEVGVALEADVAFFPAGISHPVHELVAAACRDVAVGSLPPPTIWVYEELPYRVADPVKAMLALDEWHKIGEMTLDFAGTGPVEAKELAVAAYRSQLWALDQRCLYVPERFWRLTP